MCFGSFFSRDSSAYRSLWAVKPHYASILNFFDFHLKKRPVFWLRRFVWMDLLPDCFIFHREKLENHWILGLCHKQDKNIKLMRLINPSIIMDSNRITAAAYIRESTLLAMKK